ncbi:hypothetical protein [Occultella kanbiaonis]|uniref:hypothetical protein n=1 Tax=Occultella kanbiaonis TaxID=2675754 RepID=UPI0012B7E850|nr:hypothetical protein [Occultella kanbiaonis]
MKKIAVAIGGATILAVGGGVGLSILALGDASAHSEPSTGGTEVGSQGQTSAPSQAVLDAIAELELNREQIAAQVESELGEASAVLSMPAGTEFGPVYVLEEIDSQIEMLSGDHGEELLVSGAIDPVTQWFEPGSFASLMAIDWKCAWLSTGVAAVQAGDRDAVVEVVQTLHSFAESEYVGAFPDYDYVLSLYVDPLLDGDTTGALQYLPSCEDSTRVDD